MTLWLITLLSAISAEEFLYHDDRYKVRIKGKVVNNEWVIDVCVNAPPYFYWGCNGFHTGITGSFKTIIRYYLTLVLNQLSECNAPNREGILLTIKDNLE